MVQQRHSTRSHLLKGAPIWLKKTFNKMSNFKRSLNLSSTLAKLRRSISSHLLKGARLGQLSHSRSRHLLKRAPFWLKLDIQQDIICLKGAPIWFNKDIQQEVICLKEPCFGSTKTFNKTSSVQKEPCFGSKRHHMLKRSPHLVQQRHSTRSLLLKGANFQQEAIC